MSTRVRRTIGRMILDELEDIKEEEALFLVLYDFTGKVSNYFYKNLKVIQEKTQDGVRIQKSVIQCKYSRTAKAIERLAKHYGAQVLVFRAEPVECVERGKENGSAF